MLISCSIMICQKIPTPIYIGFFLLGIVLFENEIKVARAGRFGTKGLAITFVSDETDAQTLNSVQDRFDVTISELPDQIDVGSYSKLNILV